MLKKGKLIDIRPHTRFVHFPKLCHNYIEIIYMCEGETTHIINSSTKIVLHTGDLLFLNQYSYHEILLAGQNDIGVNLIILPQFFDDTFEMVEKDSIIGRFLTIWRWRAAFQNDFAARMEWTLSTSLGQAVHSLVIKTSLNEEIEVTLGQNICIRVKEVP